MAKSDIEYCRESILKTNFGNLGRWEVWCYDQKQRFNCWFVFCKSLSLGWFLQAETSNQYIGRIQCLNRCLFFCCSGCSLQNSNLSVMWWVSFHEQKYSIEELLDECTLVTLNRSSLEGRQQSMLMALLGVLGLSKLEFKKPRPGLNDWYSSRNSKLLTEALIEAPKTFRSKDETKSFLLPFLDQNGWARKLPSHRYFCFVSVPV